MKKFCKNLRENAMNIVNYEKKENETIYKKELESFINKKLICGEEFRDNNNKNLELVTIIIEI